MNQIEIFNSPEFGSIRTLEQNGKVLFCGTDVATALGYTNPRKAVRDHTRGGTKCSIGVQTGKKADGSPAVQMVEMLFIPEGDLYRLIAHSKLPSAERFEQWVFDEVLPVIRKHGAYLTKEKLWEIATSPEALIKLCSELLAEREENASLREENALLESKAAFYDLFIDLNHSTNLRTTAKELLVPERRFVRFLLEKRFVYRTACLERFSCKSDLPVDRIKSAVLQVLSVVLFSGIAEGIHCDYGMQGILFISAFYICRNHRIYQVLLFLLAYMGTTGNQPPLCTLLACLLILLYNGKRGKLKLKYFFYVFYPAHILVLYLIQIGLGKYLLK